MVTSFRDVIAAGKRTWSIPLSTHLETNIENSTMDATASQSAAQQAAERSFGKFSQLLPPTAGYNCFGSVFASRRTAIYDIDSDLLETIVAEDGLQRISANEVRVGDILVYFDDRGPFHAARVIDLESLVLGSSTATPVVASKFNDQSGEYRHRADERWQVHVELRWEAYRERHNHPRRKGWRSTIVPTP